MKVLVMIVRIETSPRLLAGLLLDSPHCAEICVRGASCLREEFCIAQPISLRV
jgi:hypothetical protein